MKSSLTIPLVVLGLALLLAMIGGTYLSTAENFDTEKVVNPVELQEGAQIDGKNVVEFGSGTGKKDVNSGIIAYQKWTKGLDIVGADDSETEAYDRRVSLHVQGGGVDVYGPATVEGGITS